MVDVNAMNAKTLILKTLKKEVESLKVATQIETGSYKYDFAYDEILNVIEFHGKA